MLIKKQSASKNHFQFFSPINYFAGVFLLASSLFMLVFILNSTGYAYSAILSLVSHSASGISFYDFNTNVMTGIQVVDKILLFLIIMFVSSVSFIAWTSLRERLSHLRKMWRLAVEKYKTLTKRKN